MAKKASAYPSLLSCERRLNLSDGLFYACTWNHRDDGEAAQALQIREKTVRSTISNYLEGFDDKAMEEKVSKPNLQRIDFCLLPNDKDTLKVFFTLKFLSGVDQTTSCNLPDFDQKYKAFVDAYIQKTHFKELSLRYAKNIASGRFLWRNRVGAQELEIIVHVQGSDEIITFDGYDYSLEDFDPKEYDEKIKTLAELISLALSGDKPYLLLEVTAFIKLGKGQEVFPSQEMVLDKDTTSKNGKKSRILYSTFGQAAMHSQKLGNAIRTIDNWHPAKGGFDNIPIAVEPYGSVTNKNIAFRATKVDFYTLFKKAIVENKPLTQDEEDYVMAVLLRGGVFGGGSSK